MNDQRYQQGIAAYTSQFQMASEEVEPWFIRRVGERFGQETILSAAGAWADDELSLRDRNLIVMAALITQGGAEVQLRSHTRWAYRLGCTWLQLEALATLLRVYSGGPRASSGMTVIREELARVQAQ